MIEFLIILVLVLVNGVFSGAEIALLSVRRTRVRELVDERRTGARSISDLRAHPERLLATVQIGITVVGAAAAAFGGSTMAGHVAGALRPVLDDRADAVAFALVVALVSYLSLVLGELVPKSLALRSAETYALVIAPPLAALAWIGRPLVWLLTTSSNIVLRAFGDRTSFTEARLSSEELLQLVDEAASDGTVDQEVGEIASRALEFDALAVDTLMVPRRAIVALPKTATVDDVAELALGGGPARVLLYEDNLDQIVGYVQVREVLARARREPDLAVETLLHQILFLPDSLGAHQALRQLQREHVPIGVIVDEQGTVRGLVSIEDLVEELVGEILSEHDVAPRAVQLEPDGSFLVPASAAIHELNRDLGIELPESEGAGTIGGLVLEHAGEIPEAGTRIELDGWSAEVTESTERRIKSVRMTPKKP